MFSASTCVRMTLSVMAQFNLAQFMCIIKIGFPAQNTSNWQFSNPDNFFQKITVEIYIFLSLSSGTHWLSAGIGNSAQSWQDRSGENNPSSK